jgi:hypothetical protein
MAGADVAEPARSENRGRLRVCPVTSASSLD